MELYVMNQSLETIGVIDVFTSVIWVKRFLTHGEFEVYLPATPINIALLSPDNYIYRLDDEAVMIIEGVNIKSNAENGNYLTVTGRSLESILARRIVWQQTTFKGTVENLIYKLVNENAINPSLPERKISNLILGEHQGFTDTIEKQITGTNLMEAIVELCTAYQIGWKITLNEQRQFVFSLYKGVDRSYGQSENARVIFSPEFDNLIESQYVYNSQNFANVALVAGEGEGKDRKTQAVGDTADLNRYEIFVDAKSISSNSEEPLTEEQYNNVLIEQGHEKLSEQTITEAFEGEVESKQMYICKRDWNLGDIVQIENEYGISAAPCIIETIETEDTSGRKLIPTFTTWEVLKTLLIDADGYILKDSTGAVIEVGGD